MIVRPFILLAAATLAVALAGCSRPAPAQEQAEVKQTFDGFKDQVSLDHAGPALAYLDRATLDYLQAAATRPPSETEPATDLLIRRAMEKLTPGGIGPGFTLAVPVQRLLDQGVLQPRDLEPLTIGPVTLGSDGETAQAEALWQGGGTTLQLTFRREAGGWKIDLLNLLPYAGSALSMDRAIKRETEDEQIARLVGALPNP
jgi:hypothetical protein